MLQGQEQVRQNLVFFDVRLKRKSTTNQQHQRKSKEKSTTNSNSTSKYLK